MRTILLSCLCLAIISCGGNEGKPSEEMHQASSLSKPLSLNQLKAGELKILNGKIGEFPIEIQIVIEKDATVRGSYFYTKYQKQLPFKGRLAADGRMMLEVYDITTEAIEYFKGRIDEDWGFTGRWFKAEAGAERMDFELNLNKKKKITLPKKLAGTYQFDAENYSQTLRIRAAKNGQFEFQMTIGSEFCSGEIEAGIAYFHSENEANFYGEESCYINFKINEKKITVSEADCAYYHGLNCMFDGNYKKTSDKVDWITDFYPEIESLDL